jgi:hypothetical protein
MIKAKLMNFDDQSEVDEPAPEPTPWGLASS